MKRGKGMKRLSSIVVLSVLAVSILSCSSSAPQKESKVPMTPSENDALQPLMAKSQANLRYLVYGLLNFDKVKLEKSTGNLISISQYLSKSLLPQHQAHQGEWEAMCEKQEHILDDIRQSFLDDNYEQATVLFGNLITNCVGCHKIFRFGKKGKAKVIH